MILGPSLARNATLYPDKPAIIVAGGATLTHRQLNERVCRIATALQDAGVMAGRSLAILARSSAEYLELYFAAGMTGTLLVPINLHLKASDVSSRLRHSLAMALVFDSEFAPLVDELDADVRDAIKDRMWCIGTPQPSARSYEDLIAHAQASKVDWGVRPEDILYLGYTSGTTGPSKGARISQRAVVVGYLYKALAYGLNWHDVSLNPGPFWHSAPRDYASLAVYLGGTCVVTRGFEATEYFQLVERHGVTNSFMVPTMLQMLMDLPNNERFDTRTLRVLLSGGSPMTPALKARLLDRFGPCLHEFYGATETRMITTIHADEMHARPKSVGRPMHDVEITVLAEDGATLTTGQVGEVYVRGPGVFSGYFNDPVKTAQSYRGDWFSLGDMGRLDEQGYLYLVDRKQDMIISGGENIYPNDIEEVLLSCPGVKEAAVIGLAHPKWGEAVTAVVVAMDGVLELNVQMLEAACAERLPGYMRPRRFEFCDSLPRNPTGKILRRVLRDQYQTSK